MDDVTRRRAVKLSAAGAVAVLAAESALADTPTFKGGTCYTGSSKKGNFQEALDDAIKKAHDAVPGADRQIRWTFKQASGVNGGISPLNTIAVEIEVTAVT